MKRLDKKRAFIVMAALLMLFALPREVFGQQANIDIFELMQRTDLKLSEVKQQADDYFAIVGTGKGTGHNQFQRWYYEQQFHLDEDGYFISLETETEKYEEAKKSMSAPDDPSRAVWAELGPDNWNYTSGWNPGVGRVRGVAVHPFNENTIIAGSDGGGIWRSTNGGSTWTPSITNQNSAWMKIFDVEIAPSDQNRVYAALRSGGMLYSTSNGVNWVAAGSGPNNIRTIRVHPNNSNTVIVAASNGIWRSTNGGVAWTLEKSGSFEDVEFKPGNPNYVYACGTTTYCRSTNNGQSWTDISTGLTGSGRRMLAVSPNNSNYVYMVQAAGSRFDRLYRSTNSGGSWTTQVETYFTGNYSGSSPIYGRNYFGYNPNAIDHRGQAGHDMAICVSRTNVNEVHIAGIICFKSTNGGTSFTAETVWSYPNTTGYNHADVHGLEWVNNTIYSCSDGGVYKSTNQGGDWTDLSSGLGVRQFYRISCAKTNSTIISGGSQDNGTSMRQSNGTWIDWLGADGMDCIISPTNSNYCIGTSQYGNIYKTTNGGTSRSSLSRPNSGNWVTPLAAHPTVQNTVYGGWQGIYKSTNYGTSWTKISGTTIPSGQKMTCLAVAPSNANYIYGSIGSTMYRTSNDGSSWSTYTSAGGSITSIAVSATNPNKVYITTTSSSNNVKVSTNGGSSWTTISSGLPSMAARSIAVDDDANETLFVGMNIGVYTRNNSNTTWTQAATGLPLVAVNEVEIQQSGNKLRVATYGRGVWETTITNTTACNAPTSRWANNITNNSAQVNWSATSGGTWYYVRYRVNGTSTWTNHGWVQTLTNRTLTGLQSSTTYNWQVRPYCNGVYGSFSNSSNFTTLSSGCTAPTYCYGSDYQSTASSILVVWGGATGASTYRVEKNKKGSSTWSLVTSATSATQITAYGVNPGEWRFRVKSNCNATWRYSDYTPIHCASKSNNGYYLHIDYMKLQTLTRSSGNDGGYYNGQSTFASVKPGNSYWFYYSGGFTASTYPAYWRLFIDYNHDGDFTDAGEIAWSSYVNGTGTYTKNFTVPSTAKLGMTRMRLSMKYGGYASACQTFSHGEVEDYSLWISNSAPESEGQEDAKVTDDPFVEIGALTVYPNPVEDILNYSFSLIEDWKAMDVTVTAVNGQVLMRDQVEGHEGPNRNSLNVGSLAAGTYFLRVETDAGIETEKFTVIR